MRPSFSQARIIDAEIPKTSATSPILKASAGISARCAGISFFFLLAISLLWYTARG
jgi:hypothetical protein